MNRATTRSEETIRDDEVPAGAHADALVWLNRSLDGEISPRDRILLDDHLAGCVRCSAIAAQWRSIERAVRVDAKPRTPVGLVDRIVSRVTRTAAAAGETAAADAVPRFAPIRMLRMSAALAAGLVVSVGLFWLGSQPSGASAATRSPSILESQDPALLRVLERWERGHAAQPTFLELLLPKRTAGG
jgi:anti-sigma factor RsiW